MSIDSRPDALPRNNTRVAKRKPQAEISPALRQHITETAENIRAVHENELADVLRANRAGRLFSSIIRGKPVGSPKESSGASARVGSLADDVGGLVSEAIRTGTGMLEGTLTFLTQAWMTTVVGARAIPKRGVSSTAGLVFDDPSPQRPSSASQMSNATVEAAVLGDHGPEVPVSSPGEVMLRGVLRQFMPMLLTSLNQGGDGYGLAKTVITLFGRPTYDQIAGLGKDKIMQLVKGEPDLWAQVVPMEAQFSRFLDEFTGYYDEGDA